MYEKEIVMARSEKKGPRRGGATSFRSIVKLARWQIRKTWRLLLVTGIGILIAVVFVCAVPLYAQIAISAGIRNALSADPQGSYVTVHALSQHIEASPINDVGQHIQQEMSNQLGPFLGKKAQFSLQDQGLNILSHDQTPQVDRVQLTLIGATLNEAIPHLKLLSGRFPQDNSPDLEIAVTQATAASLNLAAGSSITAQAFAGNIPQAQAALRNVTFHVVGIFSLASSNDAYWHSEDFAPEQPDTGPTIYKALVSNDTLLNALSQVHANPTFGSELIYLNAPDLFWYYSLDTTRIDVNNLDGLVNGLNKVLTSISNSPVSAPFVVETQAYGPINTLSAYRNYISVVRIPATSLWLLLIGLVLYFVSVMTDILIDRKSEAIATLRSRGANRSQIFSTFVAQSIWLGFVALIIGPILAVLLVGFFAQQTLSTSDQGAINLLTLEPVQVAIGLLETALIAVVVAIVAMGFSIYRATRMDILSLRREAARSTRRPFWQRIGLDVIAAIIALVGYGFSVYVTNPSVLSTRIRVLILAPMTIVGAVFFILGATLLFLRIFPLLLRLLAWLAARSRSAAPVLALAQMARAPRQAVRTTMLLALATAFTIFALVFSASQAQRIRDVAGYEVGADFSGKISGSASVAKSSSYARLTGILSAAVGYDSSERAAQNGTDISVELRAVDANTYAQAASWTAQDSSQALAALMGQLVAQRASVTQDEMVPAIVDSAAWNILNLSVGAHFTINDLNGPITCIAIAEVQYIPTINDTIESNDTGDYIPSGGVLVDYASYAGVVLKANNVFIPTTDVWLHSAGDPAALAKARNVLLNGPLPLNNLLDRRSIIAGLQNDPLYIALLGLLLMGAVTALLLALIGNLISSWQNAQTRLSSYAVLRALGSTQQQIASVLLWEQSIVYTTSLVLGMLFGIFLSLLALPTLVFTSVGGAGSGQMTNGEFYVIQSVPPIQVVIPLSLWLTLAVLLVICVVAIGMMVRIVSRPSISQTLRLNED